jgi:AbrB family looped-hinge helix DNA binding protein
MRETATLSSKFQISIPKSVREKERWEPGQKFAFVPDAGGYKLVAVPSLANLRGLAKGADRSDTRDRGDRL